MRVTFLSHFAGRGGSTSFLQQLEGFLRARGHHTAIVVGQDAPESQVAGAQVFACAETDRARRFAAYRELVLSTGPDLVYYISGIEETELLQYLGVPRVRHIFTLERQPFIDVLYWLKQLAPYWEACSANTPDVLEEVRAAAPGDYPGLYTPYQVDEIFYQLPAEFASRAPDAPLEICYIGRIENYQKRTHWLPEIAARCQARGLNLAWHIYGDGPDRGALEQAVSRRGLRDRFTFHGWVSSDVLARRAPGHDVFFSCSFFDGLPAAMLEAMFCGLVCVVPRLPGGISYVAQHGGARAYAARTPAESAQALRSVVADRAALIDARRQTRAVAHQLFGLPVVQRQYDEIERSLARLKFNGRVRDPARPARVRLVPRRVALQRRFFGARST